MRSAPPEDRLDALRAGSWWAATRAWRFLPMRASTSPEATARSTWPSPSPRAARATSIASSSARAAPPRLPPSRWTWEPPTRCPTGSSWTPESGPGSTRKPTVSSPKRRSSSCSDHRETLELSTCEHLPNILTDARDCPFSAGLRAPTVLRRALGRRIGLDTRSFLLQPRRIRRLPLCGQLVTVCR